MSKSMSMRTYLDVQTVWLVVVAASLLSATAAEAIPPRPEAIEFQPLAYTPPKAADLRKTLPDGTVVYAAESHEFPLIDLTITFKGGDSLDPPELPGLASMMARLVREGGTAELGPAEFDETLDFLATNVSVSASTTRLPSTVTKLRSSTSPRRTR